MDTAHVEFVNNFWWLYVIYSDSSTEIEFFATQGALVNYCNLNDIWVTNTEALTDIFAKHLTNRYEY